MGSVLFNTSVNVHSFLPVTRKRWRKELSKFTDDNKWGPNNALNAREGRMVIQKDLAILEKWTHRNIMKFSKDKWKVLQTNNPLQQQRSLEYPVLGLPVDDRHQETKANLAEGQQYAQESGALALWGERETRLVQSGGKTTSEGLNTSFPIPVKRSSRRRSQAICSVSWQ